MAPASCHLCNISPSLDHKIKLILETQQYPPPPLSAVNKSSFAYKTIKDRVPDILEKTISFIESNRNGIIKFCPNSQLSGVSGKNEVALDAQQVIDELRNLLRELRNNEAAKPLTKPTLSPGLEYLNDDVDIWNAALEANRHEDGQMPRYLETSWLLAECYVYRRIKQILLQTKHLRLFDPFVEQKRAACRSSLSQMVIVSNHLRGVEEALIKSRNSIHERDEFDLFMQLALWANKSDLSLSGMSAADVQSDELLTNVRESLKSLEQNIICDNIAQVWARFQLIQNHVREKKGEQIYIDLVADNSGYEIFVDLCLVHYLTIMLDPDQEAIKHVRFRLHLKSIPWFVSDTMRVDIQWLLDYMSEQGAILKDTSTKWRCFLNSNLWELHDDKFWTLPHPFHEMPRVAKDLYTMLQSSSLIIFKGDLNYRKLTGDRSWHVLTPFHVALRDFRPCPLVALRTLKADTVVGVEDPVLYCRIEGNQMPSKWMISGEYGLIQYFEPKMLNG